MRGDLLSGGVVVVVAAALWLAYLVPTWLRRREYLSSERNAVRLQQTLRILAETSELPDEVRVEATAREVAAQRRILKRVQHETDAAARARAEAELHEAERVRRGEEAAAQRARQRAEQEEAERRRAERAAAEKARNDTANRPERSGRELARERARRRRRVRAAASLLLLAGVAAAAVGVFTVPLVGLAPVVAGLAVAGCALAALAGMARRTGRPVPAARATNLRAPDFVDLATGDEIAQAAPAPAAAWTPRPLPKPLYLSRGSAAATAMASADAVASLQRAAAREELEAAAEKIQKQTVTPLRAPRPAAAEPARRTGTDGPDPRAASRYSSMGLVGELGQPGIDLDAALRRRRAAS